MHYSQELEEIARNLTQGGRGILAADESTGTIGKRLNAVGVENSEENRRAFRELLFTAKDVSQFVSGVILYDETIRQSTADGVAFPEYMRKNNMYPGIKVDTGAKPLAGADDETVTEGLDGLRERLKEYHEIGARFAKWRAVIKIAATRPSRYALQTTAHALARYAALCQENGLVPIVEPEVLMDGDHTIQRCYEVTELTLNTVFAALYEQQVVFENMVLKPNMVISGMKCAEQAGVQEVARQTVLCLKRTVPAAVPGIAFLSGGQSDEKASAHLNAMQNYDSPWALSFSYGRALVASALKTWSGQSGQVEAAQSVLLHRARLNSEASKGSYSEAMEKQAVA